jgi:Uma2 family endonuclease
LIVRTYIKLNHYYYPDVVIRCAKETNRYAFRSPCFILEVLSPSTADKDRREELDAYSKAPTLKTYVLVAQDEKRVEIYERRRWNWTYVEIVNGAASRSPAWAKCLACPRYTPG